MTPEQKARDMLERMGVEEAQSFSAGDLAELANLINGVNERCMKIVYNETDQKIIDGQEQILEDFDHLFFKMCKSQRMTNHEAMQALQSCEQRNAMIKNIFSVRALMMPSYIVNDDC